MIRFASSAKTFDAGPNPSGGQAPVLRVVNVSGFEALSRLYRYEFEVVHSKADIDASKVIGDGAKIEFGPAGAPTRTVHGLVTEFSFFKWDNTLAWYRGVIQPRVFDVGLTRRSRVFLDKTLGEIIEEVLQGHGFSSSDDFSVPASIRDKSSAHPKRKRVVQYEESDLDFLQRWLEHDGVYFFFEQVAASGAQAGREKLIFAETTAAYRGVTVPTYKYVPATAAKSYAWDAQTAQEIDTVALTAARLPASVTLTDYDAANVALLSANAQVSGGMRGDVRIAENNFASQENGDALAQIRAQELSCRREVLSGTSNVRDMEAGVKFQMSQHPRADLCLRDFVAIEVSHQATQDVLSSAAAAATYRNTFSAIKADVLFRPRRTLAWPRLSGAQHAKVSGGETYADLDASGQYNIKLGSDGYAAEIPEVRRSQPYTAPNGGFHMPLLKDTELIVTHLEGNPDKPVIAGTVPNTNNPSPVNEDNFTHHMFMSQGGNYIDINDLNNDEIIVLGTGSYLAEAAEFLAPSYLLIGHTGSEVTTRVDYMAHNNSNLAYVGKEIVAGNDISMSAMKEFKVQVGFRPLLQLRIILQAAWVKANATISKTKTGHDSMFMPAMIYAPLLNLVMGLILGKINEKILEKMTKKVTNPREIEKPKNPDNSRGVRKQLKRAASAVGSVLKMLAETVKPNLDVLNPLAPGTLAERKEKPCFQLARSSGPRVPGTQLSIANDGENILFFTESGSFDVLAGEDVTFHADDVLRGRADSIHLDAPSGSLHLTQDRAELLSGDTDGRIAILSEAASGPLMPGQDRAAGTTKDVRVGFRHAPAPAEKWNEIVCDADGVAVGGKAFGVAIGNKSSLFMGEGAGATLSANDGDAAETVTLLRGGTRISLTDAGIVIETAAGKTLNVTLQGDCTLDAGGKNVTFEKIGALKFSANTVDLTAGTTLKLAASSVVDANGHKFQPVVPPPPLQPAVPEVQAPLVALPPLPAVVPLPATSELQQTAESARRTHFKEMIHFWNEYNNHFI